jgi:hypothetical protein
MRPHHRAALRSPGVSMGGHPWTSRDHGFARGGGRADPSRRNRTSAAVEAWRTLPARALRTDEIDRPRAEHLLLHRRSAHSARSRRGPIPRCEQRAGHHRRAPSRGAHRECREAALSRTKRQEILEAAGSWTRSPTNRSPSASRMPRQRPSGVPHWSARRRRGGCAGSAPCDSPLDFPCVDRDGARDLRPNRPSPPHGGARLRTASGHQAAARRCASAS